MLGSLFMSAAIPDAFAGSGLAFAVAYVAIQVGRNAVTLVAIGRGHPLTANFLRVLIWSVALGILWIAGGLAEGDRRVALWAAAVAIDYVVTWIGFPIPGFGRSRTPDWMIAGAHLAERNELFIILALGESILVTGATYGELPRSAATVAGLRRRLHRQRRALVALLRSRRRGGARGHYPHAPTPAGSGFRPTPTSTCRWWRASSSPPPPMS